MMYILTHDTFMLDISLFCLWWSTKAGIEECYWIGFIGCLTTPTCSQQVSTGKHSTLYSHLWCLICTFTYHLICTFIMNMMLLYGVAIPPRLLSLMPLCRVWAGYRSTSEIAEVLIRSTVSACPRVGARCYPQCLGITRRSCLEAHMVLDMEYREHERPEHGPGGPFFFSSARFVLQAVPVSITTGLGLYQRRLLLHEVIGPRYHGMCHIWSL